MGGSKVDPNQTVMEGGQMNFGKNKKTGLEIEALSESLSDEEDIAMESGQFPQDSDDEAEAFVQNIKKSKVDTSANMIFEESKNKDDNESSYSYNRTISIARPSIKNEVLTTDDFHKGMMMK